MSVTDLGAVWQSHKQDFWLNRMKSGHNPYRVVCGGIVACELDTLNARSLKLLVHDKDTKDKHYTEH